MTDQIHTEPLETSTQPLTAEQEKVLLSTTKLKYRKGETAEQFTIRVCDRAISDKLSNDQWDELGPIVQDWVNTRIGEINERDKRSQEGRPILPLEIVLSCPK